MKTSEQRFGSVRGLDREVLMRPVNEQVILITGATDGMGRQLARELAAKGATLLLHGRSESRGNATLNEIRDATHNDKLTYHRADFSSLDEVRQLARRIRDENDRLDVLVNNAGVGGGSGDHDRKLSRDGYELRFAVNYLAPFLLTHLLLPLLTASAPSRIINVSSIGQEAINFHDVMLERGYDGLRAYRQSKLAQIMFTFDLADELQGTGVTVNALHPASLMNTKMVLENFGYTMSTVEDGVAATIPLVTDPKLDTVSGRFYNQLREGRADQQAYDARARRQLRALSEQLTGIVPSGRFS
jgi:NAD(P)-dependent dehydrogenase (short-subunit alcohol dehydrogenase family)